MEEYIEILKNEIKHLTNINKNLRRIMNKKNEYRYQEIAKYVVNNSKIISEMIERLNNIEKSMNVKHKGRIIEDIKKIELLLKDILRLEIYKITGELTHEIEFEEIKNTPVTGITDVNKS